MRKKPFNFKQARGILIQSILIHLTLLGYIVEVSPNVNNNDDLNDITQIVIFKKYHPERPLLLINIEKE